MKLVVFFFVLFGAVTWTGAKPATTKQQSLDEWRSLTATTAPAPRVFVKSDQVRFYFSTSNGIEAFSAHWSHLRVPHGKYRVHTALLRWDQKLARIPEHDRGWREATVIAGADWRQLATNLLSELAPATARHGAFYEPFLSDRLLYRDADGTVRVASVSEQPKDVIVEHRFSLDESLEHVARVVESHLAQSHPGDSLFLLMAPDAKRFAQPLLLDRQQKRCVFLAPAALYDTSERGLSLAVTAQGLSALLFESHGVALIKNPISSAARLADLVVQTAVRFLRLPLPRPGSPPPLAKRPGMDLAAWERWLDAYTGTRGKLGSLQLLIDGDRFYSRLHQAVAAATNHVRFDVYIFDKDDVAVEMADLLRQRSKQVQVELVLDRMGCLGAGAVPPATPMPEDFVPPNSIIPYLTQGSRVRVRSFLNPWFSSEHSKVLLVDGAAAWLGGMNIGREYRYEWHDVMVELHGPVVSSLEVEFKRQWAHSGPLGDLAYAVELVAGPREGEANQPSVNDDTLAPEARIAPGPHRATLDLSRNEPPQAGSAALNQIQQLRFVAARRREATRSESGNYASNQGSGVPGSAGSPQIDVWPRLRLLPTKTLWKPFQTAVLGSLRKVQSYVYIENPYLFDKRVILGLVKARNRGVDVRVVLPCVNDFKAGGRSNLVIANYLHEHGVRVYFYPGMTHVKALLVDGWSCLGSGNLNHLSLRVNHEQNIATSDPAFAVRLKQDLFETDFSRSYELTAPISVDWVDFLADLALEGF